MTPSPGRDALHEAACLEQARLYSATVREQREANMRATLTPDTAENIEKRHAVLASMDDHEQARVTLLRASRRAS
jgi:hypothetical protein